MEILRDSLMREVYNTKLEFSNKQEGSSQNHYLWGEGGGGWGLFLIGLDFSDFLELHDTKLSLHGHPMFLAYINRD